MSKLYIFGTPGDVGGAATKISHLLRLLHESFDITVVPSHISFRKNKRLQHQVRELGVSYQMFNELPKSLEGVGLAICEPQFFSSGMAKRVKERGLKLVWSNEMMWEFKGEENAVKEGLIDRVLWVSEFQSQAFDHIYRGVPSMLTGNYVDPNDFKWIDRRNPAFTIGRLSRPDPEKYPYNFPAFYEDLMPYDTCFRVMAWNPELRKQYRWHRFDHRWSFHTADSMPARKFLNQLDLFVYPLGHRIQESWGRAVVEAMLTGCVPLVPTGHQFHKLMIHEESGFICDSFDEWQGYANRLRDDYSYRLHIARNARDYACQELCSPTKHRQVWEQALTI